MKSKGPSRDYLQKGAAAELAWTTVSRRTSPPPGAPAEGEVAYGVRSSEDIVTGFGRRDKSGAR